MKLSKVQKEIVDLMKNGWELGFSSSCNSSRAWLQKNGVGKGGESKKLSVATFFKIRELGLIEEVEVKYPITKYQLKKNI